MDFLAKFVKQNSGFLISRCPVLVKPNSAEQKLAMLLLHELSHGLLTLNSPDIMLEKQKHILDYKVPQWTIWFLDYGNLI